MGHSDNTKHRKANALNIRLTESAVFLPIDSFAPIRRRSRAPDSRTSTLRGLLVLELVKPTKISSIDIELVATTSTAWPEGIGARRIDVTEDHRVFYASTVFFSGSKHPSRRTASIGPGVSYSRFSNYLEPDDDFRDDLDDGVWDDLQRQSGPGSAAFASGEAGPSNLAGYSNEPSTSAAADTVTSTNASRRSFPYPDLLQRHSNRRFSVDANRPRPLYETPHELETLSRSELEHLAPIPPYSPFPDPTTESISALTAPVSPIGPAQSLEEFRNSLHSSLRSPPSLHTESPADSALSLSSASQTGDGIVPRRPSDLASHSPEENMISRSAPRRRSVSSTRTRTERRLSHSTSPLPPIQAQGRAETSTTSPAMAPEKERGRKRFSLTNIFKHSGKLGLSRERHHDVPRREVSVDSERPHGSPIERETGLLEGMEEEEEEQRPHRSKERGRGVIGRILQDNLIHGSKEKEDWKEFRAGTYSYPVSFSIPADAPPTMRCEFGSVVWQLKANVHRPGAFKTKLTAMRDVIVISCPTEEDTEDTENIIVERQWEQQLQYLIAVSGRSFYIGGTIPVMFTLMPLTKMKVYRMSIYIEERVDYYTNMRRIARSDLPTRTCLLSVKGGKGGEPILPLDSDSPDALRNSPLYSIFDPNTPDNELSEIASNLMGPGPWTFHQNLQLPKSCDELRFTNKNRRSNIAVSHLLKVVLRVQRGDDVHVDPKTGKRKLFDIVVQTPVLILSCRCNPEWMALPRYAEALEDSALIVPSCPCQVERNRILSGSTSGILSSTFLERMTSRRSSDSSGASAAETHLVHPQSSTFIRQSSYTDSILQSNSLFERLVSGQESSSGEAPPSYDTASRLPLATISSLSRSHTSGVTVI